MATFRTLPSGKIQVQIRMAGVKPVSSTHDTKEDAQAWVKQQEKLLAVHTVKALAPDYLKSLYSADRKSRGGYDSIYHKLNVIARTIADKPLEQLTKADVLEYKEKRSPCVSGSTIRLELQLLSRFLRWAKDERDIDCEDVVKSVKLPAAGKAREKTVEPIELQRIIDNAPERARDFLALAYETAMRRNELLAVTPAMIDFKTRVIHLTDDQTKNHTARGVPLTKKAVEILTRLCDGKDKHARLFNYSPYGITQAFRKAARKAGVLGVCLHSLRHSAITNAAEKGLSIMQLQVVSGHKDIKMLARYTHIKASNVANLLD